MRRASSARWAGMAVAAFLLLTSCSPSATTGADEKLSLPDPQKDARMYAPDVFTSPGEDDPVGAIHALQERSDAPSGSQGWNMVYVSELWPGQKAHVAGEVYVPTTPSAEPRDIVLWNHETVGSADSCAPSRRAPVGRIPGIEELLKRGYVVVMSDYPGLGLPGPAFYMVGAVNARASLDALKAATSLPELRLSGRYVQYGWSQGGQTTLHAEAMADDYAADWEGLGSAVIAPVSRLGEQVAGDLQDPAWAGYVMAALPGIKALYPELRFSDVLTPEAMERLPEFGHGCVDSWESLGFSESPYTPTAFQEGTAWRRALDQVDDFSSAGSMPFVIYQGTEDWITPAEQTRREAGRLCAAGSAVEYREFEGLDHSTVVPEAAILFPEWAEARFTGSLSANDCDDFAQDVG